MSCNDCVHKNKCLERSRDYPCTSCVKTLDDVPDRLKEAVKAILEDDN